MKQVVRHARSKGITEQFWRDESAEFRLGWGFTSKIFAIVVPVLVVEQAGSPLLDSVLPAISGLVTLGIISTQRDYSKFRVRTRRWIVRLLVGICLYATSAAGLAYYLSMVGGASANIFARLSSSVDPRFEPFGSLLVLGFMSVVMIRASVDVLRRSGYGEVIYALPKAGFIRLFVTRRWRVNEFHQFVMFETTVLLLGIAYGAFWNAITTNLGGGAALA